MEMPPLLRGRLAASGVKLKLELQPKLGIVRADRIQLQQVIFNLISNGIDAIQLAGSERREITVNTRESGGLVETSVRDSGPGIGQEDAEKLFSRFYTTKSGGLGMGLAISRSIVNACGGEIWAESSMGVGATFTFSLPVAG